MGRMSQLHADTAEERARAAESECSYLDMIIQDLIPLAVKVATWPCYCRISKDRCAACMAREIIDRHGLVAKP